MTSTLKERWNRLIGNRSADAGKNGVESIDDKKADASVAEHLGGINPERLLTDEEPPQS